MKKEKIKKYVINLILFFSVLLFCFVFLEITLRFYPENKLQQIAKENNIKIIKTDALISNKPDPKTKYVNFDKKFILDSYDGHFNEKGHKKLAELLLEYLNKNQMNLN